MNELTILGRVSSQINATLDEQRIFEILLGTMDELFGFHHALILWVEDDALRVVAGHGYPDLRIGTEVALGHGVLGVVAKKRKVMRMNNLRQQRAYAATVREQLAQAGQLPAESTEAELPGLADVECQIAIPMQIGDELVGVFSVESAEPFKRFDAHEEQLATILANQAAATIHNARLVTGLEDRVRTRTSELEHANRDLRDAQARLVQTGKMASLGQLVAGVAHELNTPIGSIVSSADVASRALTILEDGLRSEAQSDRKIARAVASLRRSYEVEAEAAKRVADIVRSLRNFARLDEAHQKLADLHEGIHSTLTLMTEELRGLQVELRLGELPEVMCYPNQLNQVVMHVLRNARQATPDGGTITIETRVDGGELLLVVTDTGAGIEPTDLPYVFDPGFTRRGVGVGTGLGLSICYQIMEQHRGRIGITSAVGTGTAVTLRIPRSISDRTTIPQ